MYQGYGEPIISTVLPHVSKSTHGLYIWDHLVLSPGDTLAFEVSWTSIAVVELVNMIFSPKATLGWYDPPNPNFASTQFQLVHDLDLAVVMPNGSHYSSKPSISSYHASCYCDRLEELYRQPQHGRDGASTPPSTSLPTHQRRKKLHIYSVGARQAFYGIYTDKNESIPCSFVITADRTARVSEPHARFVWGQTLPLASISKRFSSNDRKRARSSLLYR